MSDDIPDTPPAAIAANKLTDDIPMIATLGRDFHDILFELSEMVFNHTRDTWRKRNLFPNYKTWCMERCREVRARAQTKQVYKANRSAGILDFTTMKTIMEINPLPRFKDRTYGVHPDTGLLYYWASEIFEDEDGDDEPNEDAPIPSF